MAELLMITEEVENLIKKIGETVINVADNHNNILNQANNLIPGQWESESASIFLERLNTFIRDYSKKLEEMMELDHTLETELGQWFETADTFKY